VFSVLPAMTNVFTWRMCLNGNLFSHGVQYELAFRLSGIRLRIYVWNAAAVCL